MKKQRTWNDVEKALKDAAGKRDMPASDDFWSDFKAHAGLRNQEATVAERRSPWFYGWSLATACAILLLAAGVLYLVGTPQSAVGSEIKMFDVSADHSAVIIMNEEPEEATVLWIVDMEVEDDTEAI